MISFTAVFQTVPTILSAGTSIKSAPEINFSVLISNLYDRARKFYSSIADSAIYSKKHMDPIVSRISHNSSLLIISVLHGEHINLMTYRQMANIHFPEF